MQRTLITGAGGFVGANLARRALREGHEVHAVVRPGGPSWRLADVADRLHLHAVDLGEKNAVIQAVRTVRPQWVFHLAAHGAYPRQTDAGRMTATNVLGSLHLLEACAASGVEALVHSGSSSEYGYKDHAPGEEERVEPNSVYAVTKSAATHLCQLVARERDFHAVTVRLYSVYGPWEEPGRLVPSLVTHALAGRLPPLVSPTVGRDFVYVDDAVEGLLRVAAASSVPRGTIYNLASGVHTTLADLVALVQRVLDVREVPVWGTMERRAWDTDVWVGSPAALQRDLGWRPRIRIDEGLADTIRWFREDPARVELYERRRSGEAGRS